MFILIPYNMIEMHLYSILISAQIVPGLLVLAIAYLGCNITLVLIAWFCAVTLITASYAGAMANVVDIAPNLAGKFLHKLSSPYIPYCLMRAQA